MDSQLIVIHKSRSEEDCGQNSQSDLFAAENFINNPKCHSWIYWETCIRKIAIGTIEKIVSETTANDKQLSERNKDSKGHDDNDGKNGHDGLYVGAAAKKFLLEVVCGLHSPVRGETEVHGQYKELLSRIPKEHALYSQLVSLHLKARQVRDRYLRGLGSQSYGSLARRKVRAADEIHILGAGGLARKMLPWLMKLEAPLKIYVRNKSRVSGDISRYAQRENKLKIYELASGLDVQGDHSAVIVAAPLPSEAIVHLIESSHRPCHLILDYRGESIYDPIRYPTAYLSLQDIFREIESNKQKIEQEIEQAKALIQTLSH